MIRWVENHYDSIYPRCNLLFLSQIFQYLNPPHTFTRSSKSHASQIPLTYPLMPVWLWEIEKVSVYGSVCMFTLYFNDLYVALHPKDHLLSQIDINFWYFRHVYNYSTYWDPTSWPKHEASFSYNDDKRAMGKQSILPLNNQ